LKNAIATIIICFLAISLLYCSQGEQKVTLRFKYEPGLNLKYEQLTKRNTKVFENGEMTESYSRNYDMTVKQSVVGIAADGTAEIVEEDSWVYIKPNEKDSTIIDTVMHSRELTMNVAANGKVVKVGFADDTDAATISYLKNYFEQAWPVFPDGELPVGYSWTQTATVVMTDETLEASTTYSIKSLVREAGYDCAVVDYSGNMLIPLMPSAKKPEFIGGIDRIKTSGVIYFAYKEGVVVLQREQWTIHGERQKRSDKGVVDITVEVELDSDYTLVHREKI